MNENALFVFVCGTLLAFVLILARYRTGLLGLSLLNAAYVGSAGFAAFLFGAATGVPMNWFTSAHAEVVKYCAGGCLAMAAGLFLAWLPLRRMRLKALRPKLLFPPLPKWINPTFGWACFGVGVAATVSLRLLGAVPTVSTALYGLQNLTRFGILIFMIIGLRAGKWDHFLFAVGLALPLLVAGALQSGHTPLSVSLLLPLALILAFHRRVSLFSFALVGVTGVCYLVLMSAWMSTRGMIRSGEMSDYRIGQQTQVFLSTYLQRLSIANMNVNDIQEMLRERIDMSELLAQQSIYQPEFEPYAHGKTFLAAFTAVIPRALWPGKPQIAGGSEFVKRFTGMVRSADDNTSIGLPYQFEFYANGGPWLVVIGLFLLGYVSGRMELALFCEFTSVGKLLSLVISTLVVCDGGQRADVTIPSIVSGALAGWAIGWCIDRFAPGFARQILGFRPRDDWSGQNKNQAVSLEMTSNFGCEDIRQSLNIGETIAPRRK